MSLWVNTVTLWRMRGCSEPWADSPLGSSSDAGRKTTPRWLTADLCFYLFNCGGLKKKKNSHAIAFPLSGISIAPQTQPRHHRKVCPIDRASPRCPQASVWSGPPCNNGGALAWRWWKRQNKARAAGFPTAATLWTSFQSSSLLQIWFCNSSQPPSLAKEEGNKAQIFISVNQVTLLERLSDNSLHLYLHLFCLLLTIFAKLLLLLSLKVFTRFSLETIHLLLHYRRCCLKWWYLNSLLIGC